MKINYFLAAFAAVIVLLSSSLPTNAQTYILANGGSYWTQSGTEWHIRNNDGYCISGRGPCGSSLWYHQWSYNHVGCGLDEWGRWTPPTVMAVGGEVSAWIDDVHGTMYGADYNVEHGGASDLRVSINQYLANDEWVPIASGITYINDVMLTDGWSYLYICNSISNKQVLFDEMRLKY